ncbi:unnamed protein product [Ranitomeya imitator]|uniref:RING-type domain-containing protein n=1 Tax=Ranitomeya imitator TaxID=111125 RepID=A0ABN9LJI6_9NEOB|nr:unnamed protein product [Ranitomeya imitator]
MDESSLLDLLDCSMCLERMDTTAQVLLCQHTFCCRCMQSIVSSRKELCCPECRILVECRVDDLPANILLVQLLDRIRQRPRNSPTGSPTAGGHHCAGSNNSNNHSPGCAAMGGSQSHTSSLRDLAAVSQNVILLTKVFSNSSILSKMFASSDSQSRGRDDVTTVRATQPLCPERHRAGETLTAPDLR